MAISYFLLCQNKERIKNYLSYNTINVMIVPVIILHGIQHKNCDKK